MSDFKSKKGGFWYDVSSFVFGFKGGHGEILNHWIAFAEGTAITPKEFYADLEKQLAARDITGMKISRIEYAEGGLLSEKREYLRLVREWLVFDICAAPFGGGYFFSCRTLYEPPALKLWHLLAAVLFFFLTYSALASFLGYNLALVALIGLGVAIAQMLRNAIALGLSDIDSALMKTPVIGPVYVCFFRKETYFRADTRLLYLEAIPRMVKELAQEMVAAKGVKLGRQFTQTPTLGGSYHPIPPSGTPERVSYAFGP